MCHWDAHKAYSAALPCCLESLAASQCVIANILTSTFISEICLMAVKAPLVWPDTTSTSGLVALTFDRVAAISLSSFGNLSSIMIFELVLSAASTIPNLTSWEKASCSNAMAILTGFPPFFSTAKSIATSKYKFAGASTANKYLYPFVNNDLDAPLASTIGILYFSVTGAIALVNPELYGPSINWTPSCLINLSASWAARPEFDSSS